MGILKKEVYIAESLFRSKDLKCIFHYNPKYNIDEIGNVRKRIKRI